MNDERYLYFDDVSFPLRLKEAPEVSGLIEAVMPGWPVSEGNRAQESFFSIIAEGGGRYRCESPITGAEPRMLDLVNAVCDMIASLSFALVASQSHYLCLHAGAVGIGGRLVLLPETRRAGKSTLTAALAWLGRDVFTDDFLPVRFDNAGRLMGRAGGILPRIRLPLPESLDPGFIEWAGANAGPKNKQYKYLETKALPDAGTLAPIGAIVVPEREDGLTPSLERLSPDEIMDRLLFQNFTREVHSVDVLRILARLAEVIPAWRLRYGEATDAARFLNETFEAWPDPVPADATLSGALARADFEARAGAAGVAPGRAFRRRPGAAMADLGGACYLADPEGGGIHRLNPVSQAIWAMLAEPLSAYEARDALAEVFPDTDPMQIEADVLAFMSDLSRARLLTEI